MNQSVSSLRETMRRSPARPDADATPLPLRRAAAIRTQGLFARLFDRPATWVRRHKRYACCTVAVLTISGRGVPIDGLVTEISQGGLVFRPASMFIYDRRGASIEVRFGAFAAAGRILNVTAHGYGIRLDLDIDGATLDTILRDFGLRPNAA